MPNLQTRIADMIAGLLVNYCAGPRFVWRVRCALIYLGNKFMILALKCDRALFIRFVELRHRLHVLILRKKFRLAEKCYTSACQLYQKSPEKFREVFGFDVYDPHYAKQRDGTRNSEYPKERVEQVTFHVDGGVMTPNDKSSPTGATENSERKTP